MNFHVLWVSAFSLKPMVFGLADVEDEFRVRTKRRRYVAHMKRFHYGEKKRNCSQNRANGNGNNKQLHRNVNFLTDDHI